MAIAKKPILTKKPVIPKKPANPKRPLKKKRKSTNGCLIITVLLAALVAISLAATFYFLFLRTGPTTVAPSPRSAAAPTRPSAPTPRPQEGGAVTPQLATPPTPADAETTPEPAPEPTTTPPEPPVPTPSSPTGPRIAIIIDDIGTTREIAEQLIALDLPLTFAIMPHTPHANHLAMLAKARGHDILLHLPMEANDPKWSPSPGTLLLSMSKPELIATIDRDLDTPYRPIGINNHMGSRFTEDPVAMRVFLNAIKPRGLFFIDSLTSLNSVGYTLARDLGLKTARRDVFLDNVQDRTKILAQLGRVIALAERHGSAIAIGHPYPATLEALVAARARLGQEITVVPVHELVE